MLDPARNTPSKIPVSPRDPKNAGRAKSHSQPSPYWGREAIWTSRIDIHNPMIDGQGRVWMTARVRAPQNRHSASRGSSHPSAKMFPIDSAARQAAVRPEDEKADADRYVLRHAPSGCSPKSATHTLVRRLRQPVSGLDQHEAFDESGDEMKSQGWTPLILDTNGNGRRERMPKQTSRSIRQNTNGSVMRVHGQPRS